MPPPPVKRFLKNEDINLMRVVFIEAAVIGDLVKVRLLLDKGVDINHRDEMGITALMFAVEKGHAEVVTLLLNAGADIHHQDEKGITALMVAAEKGCVAIIKLLLDAGADINLQNSWGGSALILATDFGHVDTIKLLQTYAADIHQEGYRRISNEQNEVDGTKLSFWNNFYVGYVVGDFVLSPISNYLNDKVINFNHTKSISTYYYDYYEQLNVRLIVESFVFPAVSKNFKFYGCHDVNSIIFSKIFIDAVESTYKLDFKMPSIKYLNGLISLTLTSFVTFCFQDKVMHYTGFKAPQSAWEGFAIAFQNKVIASTANILSNKYTSFYSPVESHNVVSGDVDSFDNDLILECLMLFKQRL